MTNLFKRIILSLTLFAFSVLGFSQTSQELLNMGLEMGLSIEEMQSLYNQQGGSLDMFSKSKSNERSSYSSYTDQNEPVVRDINEMEGLTARQSTSNYDNMYMDPSQLEMLKIRKEEARKERLLSVFGQNMFKNDSISFEPTLYIPTPTNYMLSAGDEIFITVWGDSELLVRETISPDGTINIQGLGLVMLNGLTINDATKKIEQELSRINSSIGETSKVTVSVGKIRSIKVHLTGEVSNPGTYTLPSLATVLHVLYTSAGTNEIGDMRNIDVFRDSKCVASFDLYKFMAEGDFSGNIVLQDNDVIVVRPYVSKVYAAGAVKRNMYYQLKEGESVAKLLDFAGGFSDNGYKSAVRIYRKSEEYKEVHEVNSDNFSNFALIDGDSLVVDLGKNEFSNIITISGAVWRAGDYPLNESTRTLSSLIEKVGGLKGDAFSTAALITRRNEDYTNSSIKFNPLDIVMGKSDIELQNYDKVYIPNINSLQERRIVVTQGELNKPDTLEYTDNMRIEDAIILSGGLTDAASLSFIDVARISKDQVQTDYTADRAKVYTFKINKDLTLSENSENFILEPSDIIIVRRSPHYKEPVAFMVNGEVLTPGVHVISNEKTYLSDVVRLANGLTPEAYLKGARLLRAYNEDDLDVTEKVKSLTSTMSPAETLDVDQVAKNSYSVAIDLEAALKNPRGAKDIQIKKGDIVTIPKMVNTVNVVGAVYFPNATAFISDKIKDYVDASGGYSRVARKKPFVIYPNGSVKSSKGKKPTVEPGCIIVVPVKGEGSKMSTAEVMSLVTGATSLSTALASMGVILAN